MDRISSKSNSIVLECAGFLLSGSPIGKHTLILWLFTLRKERARLSCGWC